MKHKVKLAIYTDGIRSTQKQNVSVVILDGKKTGSGWRKSSPSNQFYGSDTPASHENCRRSFLKTDTWVLHPRGLAISGTESRISIFFKKTITFTG